LQALKEKQANPDLKWEESTIRKDIKNSEANLEKKGDQKLKNYVTNTRLTIKAWWKNLDEPEDAAETKSAFSRVGPNDISFPLPVKGTQNTFDNKDELRFLRSPEFESNALPADLISFLKQQVADVLNEGALLYPLDKKLRKYEAWNKSAPTHHKQKKIEDLQKQIEPLLLNRANLEDNFIFILRALKEKQANPNLKWEETTIRKDIKNSEANLEKKGDKKLMNYVTNTRLTIKAWWKQSEVTVADNPWKNFKETQQSALKWVGKNIAVNKKADTNELKENLKKFGLDELLLKYPKLDELNSDL
jgi:hypothetical protein